MRLIAEPLGSCWNSASAWSCSAAPYGVSAGQITSLEPVLAQPVSDIVVSRTASGSLGHRIGFLRGGLVDDAVLGGRAGLVRARGDVPEREPDQEAAQRDDGDDGASDDDVGRHCAAFGFESFR